MSTNFYLYPPACSECGRAEDARHIGKRSVGWVFLLHVEVDFGESVPYTLEDWKTLFETDGLDIIDEHGTHWTTAAMLVVILGEDGKRRSTDDPRNLPAEGFPYDRATGVFQ